MNKSPSRQRGASTIGTIITLAVLAYAVYVGIQYAPMAMESKSVDSILDSVKSDNRSNPANTEYDAKLKVVKRMQINEMNDLVENVEVTRAGGRTTITVSYDRELDLLYEKRTMHYEKSVVLD